MTCWVTAAPTIGRFDADIEVVGPAELKDAFAHLHNADLPTDIVATLAQDTAAFVRSSTPARPDLAGVCTPDELNPQFTGRALDVVQHGVVPEQSGFVSGQVIYAPSG